MKPLFRTLVLLLVAALLITSVSTGAFAADVDNSAKTTAGSTAEQDVKVYDLQQKNKEVFSKYKYSDYLRDNSDKTDATEAIVWGASENIVSRSDDVVSVADADDTLPEGSIAGKTISTTEKSTVTWEVDVPADGMYTLNVLYYNVEGKKSDAERAVSIDGELPFTEAASLAFPRTWTDEIAANENGPDTTGFRNFERDIDGNDIRPKSIEVNVWTYLDCRDNSGIYDKPFKFFLSAGKHTITFESQREPLYINSIKLYTPEALPSYNELQEEYKSLGYQMIDDSQASAVRVQAEKMELKSSATIYPEYDRTSAAMEPESYDTIHLNQISSEKFTSPYQWVRWNFKVEKSGLYRIVTRFDQHSRDGAFCSRILKINGEIPCEEARYVRFNYDDSWQVSAISDAKGNDMYFYFDAEKENIIELQVTLGEFADIVDRVDSIVYSLNNCYRSILMITGSDPDTYRDYQFDVLVPEVLEQMEKDAQTLKNVISDIETLTGEEGGSFVSNFKTLLFDVESMVEQPSVIAKRLQNFKSNLGTISTWILDASSQPIGFDWIQVTPAPAGEEDELPEAEGGFFASLWHQVRLFLSSFYMEYDNVGRTEASEKGTREVSVWVTTSLDQSQILRQLINNELAKTSDLKVDLKLVAPTTVLPAIAAGTGPDVVLGVANAEPLNYAIRNAVVDLSKFENFEEVKARFAECATVPYTYKGKTYGIPETFIFPMLFYRKDIASELELGVPETWEDVYNCIVKLNMNSMMFGVSAVAGTITDFNVFGSLIYQNGAQFYVGEGTDDPNAGSKSALDTATAIRCFKQWTDFYTSYGSLVSFDFSNRFRTGEMPMGISAYSTYNQLSVFATEIKGLWGFANLPGVRKADGTIDHTSTSGGTASVILSDCEDPQAAWDFLCWWTSADIQTQYGLEMEAILGTAARYNTANVEAMGRLPWSTADYNSIMSQWEATRAIPEYPGSYILSRYIAFAFLDVVNNGEEPGEELLDNIKLINEELTRKRKEFEG